MARMIEVQVRRWQGSGASRAFEWQTIPVEEGLRLRDETFRCPVCLGKAVLKSASASPPWLHMESMTGGTRGAHSEIATTSRGFVFIHLLSNDAAHSLCKGLPPPFFLHAESASNINIVCNVVVQRR